MKLAGAESAGYDFIKLGRATRHGHITTLDIALTVDLKSHPNALVGCGTAGRGVENGAVA